MGRPKAKSGVTGRLACGRCRRLRSHGLIRYMGLRTFLRARFRAIKAPTTTCRTIKQRCRSTLLKRRPSRCAAAQCLLGTTKQPRLPDPAILSILRATDHVPGGADAAGGPSSHRSRRRSDSDNFPRATRADSTEFGSGKPRDGGGSGTTKALDTPRAQPAAWLRCRGWHGFHRDRDWNEHLFSESSGESGRPHRSLGGIGR